jgi:hypothetical protein
MFAAFPGDDPSLSFVRNQSIVVLYNRFTFEETLFNALRGYRSATFLRAFKNKAACIVGLIQHISILGYAYANFICRISHFILFNGYLFRLCPAYSAFSVRMLWLPHFPLWGTGRAMQRHCLRIKRQSFRR